MINNICFKTVIRFKIFIWKFISNNNLELNEEILKAQADIVELTTTRNNAKEAFNNLVGEIKGIVKEASTKSSEIAELKVYKANYIKVLAKIAKLEKEKKAERT